MAERNNSIGIMGFVLGAVVVVLAGLVYFIFVGELPSDNDAEIKIDLPDGNG